MERATDVIIYGVRGVKMLSEYTTRQLIQEIVKRRTLKTDESQRYFYYLETLEYAKNYGYSTIDDLIITEYLKGRTLRQIGKMIDKKATAVRYQLNRLGVSEQRRKQQQKKPSEYPLRVKLRGWQKDYPCMVCKKKIEMGAEYYGDNSRFKYHKECIDAL